MFNIGVFSQYDAPLALVESLECASFLSMRSSITLFVLGLFLFNSRTAIAGAIIGLGFFYFVFTIFVTTI